MKNLLKLVVILFSISIAGQEATQQEEFKKKVENFILQNEIDSANYYLNRLDTSNYKLILEKVVSEEIPSYQEYYTFFSNLTNRNSLTYEIVSDFLDQTIKTPETNIFNEFFFRIKCDQIYKLRDNVSIEKASEKYAEIEKYISKFDEKDIQIQKARLRIQTHPIVIYQIKREVEKGKKLVLESLKKSRELKDIELQIMFLYHLSDFLILERKLQEYINVSEEGLKLEEQLPKKSPYYLATLQHLIDAYIYKGGYNDKIMSLIGELYNNSTFRIQTFSLYLDLISNSIKTPEIKNEIFKKFEVNDLKELVEKFQTLGKDLNSNDYNQLLYFSSKVLESNNFLREALAFKDKTIAHTKKIYSEDLSKSLANYQVAQAIKTKQQEITNEKEKNKLYSIILVLVFLFLIICLLIIGKVRKQSKELTKKNKIIRKSLNQRDLLIKEVHHRVKNNFQIVSSLLELQTKGISDKKALQLANEGKNRVKSMALIHQKLYQNETGLVDFSEYVLMLTKELAAIYTLQNKVETKIDSENMLFDVDTAIPLGLIINEIITNSYKHAFKNDKENKLFISIYKAEEDYYKLTIKDNGPGIKESLDVKKAKSLGLRLVNRLVKQLQGTLEQFNDEGTKFVISFKDMHIRKRIN